MAKSAAEILDEYENGQNPHQSEEYRLNKALKQLHDEVIEGLPKKLEVTEMNTEYYKTRFQQVKGYNTAIDDVTKFIGEYFKKEKTK